MDLVKGTLCFCRSGKKVEECCIDFDSPVAPEIQMKMRYKYRHLKDDDEIIELARQTQEGIELDTYTITDEDLQYMKRCSAIIAEKTNMDIFHELFSTEYVVISRYEDDIKQRKTRDKDKDINRLAVNFVSNAKLFIDFLENFVEEKYPESFTEWKELQSRFFDERYEYAIMYHLRNHVQHVGLPIRVINKKLIEMDGEEKVEVEFCLSKKDLLEDKKLNKHAKERISKMEMADDNISFMPLVQEYSGMIQALYMLALSLYYKHYKVELRELEEYFIRRGFVERIYTARVKKKNYFNGTLNGIKLTPLYGRADIYNLYMELEKAGVIKVV